VDAPCKQWHTVKLISERLVDEHGVGKISYQMAWPSPPLWPHPRSSWHRSALTLQGLSTGSASSEQPGLL
jgi:hypothetical protein